MPSNANGNSCLTHGWLSSCWGFVLGQSGSYSSDSGSDFLLSTASLQEELSAAAHIAGPLHSYSWLYCHFALSVQDVGKHSSCRQSAGLAAPPPNTRHPHTAARPDLSLTHNSASALSPSDSARYACRPSHSDGRSSLSWAQEQDDDLAQAILIAP